MATRDEVEHLRKVAEQQPERRIGRGEAGATAGGPGERVDPGDLDAHAAKLDLDALVPQQPAPGNVVEPHRPRERISAERMVVVAQDDEGRAEAAEQPLEHRGAAGPRDEIAGDTDEIRLALGDPVDGAFDGVPPAEGTPRWKSERCATRSPSSSGGSPGTGRSRTRRRTQPASNAPHPSPASAAAPAAAPSSRRDGSGLELLEHGLHRDDVPLELELRLLDARPPRRRAATDAGSAS